MITHVPLTIRPAHQGDRPFIDALSRAAFSEYTPRADRRTAELREGARTITLIADRDERPIGFAVLAAGRATAYLAAIAVSESERGRRVGKKLLDAVAASARVRGATRLVLHTADSNVAALDLFLRAGFETTERIRRFYARGQDAVRMEKRLG